MPLILKRNLKLPGGGGGGVIGNGEPPCSLAMTRTINNELEILEESSTPTSTSACARPVTGGWLLGDQRAKTGEATEGQLAAICPGFWHLKHSRRR